MTAFLLHVSASLASAQGQPVRSAQLWGAAAALRETLRITFSPIQRYYYEPYIAAARTLLGEVWGAAWAEGRTMSLEEAIEYALSHEEAATSIPAAPPAVLTPREEEVAALVAQGITNRQIASELFISEHTAATHVRRILKKLGLRSRAQIGSWLAEQRPFSTDLG